MREHATRVRPYPCICAFAKVVGDRDPTHFPRVGLFDMVLYRGGFIVRHTKTGIEANIYNPERGSLHAEADRCCHDWFERTRVPRRTKEVTARRGEEEVPRRTEEVVAGEAAPVARGAWELLESRRGAESPGG